MPGSTVWHPAKHFVRASIPKDLRPWLIDPRSLTRRVRQACPHAFSLRLLDESWERPLRDEAGELRLGQGRAAFVRQVLLICGELPWVFARSVIPEQTLRGSRRRLTCLGTRPLGAVLFADRSMRRGEVKVAALGTDHPLHRMASTTGEYGDATLWSRRSAFYLEGKPLLVSEVFLPGLRRKHA